MILLRDKYCPKSPNDLMFNGHILNTMISMTHNNNIQHMILNGPNGGGKKTLTSIYLSSLYDSAVNDITNVEYNPKNAPKKKSVKMMQSKHHVIFEATKTNHDKHSLLEMLTSFIGDKTGMVFGNMKHHKTIVIFNVENLLESAQSAIKKIMEQDANHCKFILISNNSNNILPAIQSRCQIINVPLPNKNDIRNCIFKIAINEGLKLTVEQQEYIFDKSNNSLKTAIWILQNIVFDTEYKNSLDNFYTHIIMEMLKCNNSNLIEKLNKIRIKSYDIIVSTLSPNKIIFELISKIIHMYEYGKGENNKKDVISTSLAKRLNDEKINKIIEISNNVSLNFRGRKEIPHYEYIFHYIILLLNEP